MGAGPVPQTGQMHPAEASLRFFSRSHVCCSAPGLQLGVGALAVVGALLPAVLLEAALGEVSGWAWMIEA